MSNLFLPIAPFPVPLCISPWISNPYKFGRGVQILDFFHTSDNVGMVWHHTTLLSLGLTLLVLMGKKNSIINIIFDKTAYLNM